MSKIILALSALLLLVSGCAKPGAPATAQPGSPQPETTTTEQVTPPTPPAHHDVWTPATEQTTPVESEACNGLTPSAKVTAGRRLSDAGYLRKLSLHLRGLAPTSSDYAALAAAPDKEAFINAQLDQFMKDPRYEARMVFRLSERFRVRPPNQLGAEAPNYGDRVDPEAMSELFGRIARENQSWDQLFTGTNYVAYPVAKDSNPSIGSDFGFFRAIFPQLPNENRGALNLNEEADPTVLTEPGSTLSPMPVSFPADDTRVAGAFTTARFMTRYATTALNKNRRRAAAIYNIALCDSMLPSAFTGTDPKHDFLNKSFANNFAVTEGEIAKSVEAPADSLHGSNTECRACHMKLDPMGKTFQNIGTTLNPIPSPGALVLRRSATDVFVQKVAGIGELTRAIVKQPEYVDCQTRYLWTQFIGEDVPLTKSRADALRCDFRSSARKTNDFIKKIVMSADFRIEPTDRGQLLFSDVKDLMKRCDSCHANEDGIPLFASLPIRSLDGKIESGKWLAAITRRMNLPETSDKRMPKDWKTNWSEEDLGKLRRWIDEGAKDDDGQPLGDARTK